MDRKFCSILLTAIISTCAVSGSAQGNPPKIIIDFSIPNNEASGKVILLPSPGDNQDIQPSLQAAVDSASPGDTILLPPGNFYFDGKVVVDKFINIRGSGSENNGTKIYRREDISNTELENWRTMLEFRCYSDEPSHIVVSDIHFKGKNPSLIPGDGGSTVNDYGIQLKRCVDFVIARNKFEHFGFAAVNVFHRDALARGLVAENTFYQNLNIEPGSDYFNLGYGVVIYGEDEEWIQDPQFGTDNFIFIEDNTFVEHRHSIAGGGTGRYIFRRNQIIDNLVSSAVDAHGGGKWGNTFSTRAFEVYDNEITNTRFKDGTPINEPPPNGPCSDLAYSAIHFRGGEGIVYGNTIQGFRHGASVTTEITGGYPVITQIGYLSGLNMGPSHSGIEPPASEGDIFIWANNFIPYDDSSCIKQFRNFREELLVEGRDYHLDTQKPGYSPYPYPHPLRSLIPSPTPTFADVPFDYWDYDYIEAIYQAGYTAGCATNPLRYCPDDTMTREESAVFVVRGVHTTDFAPPQPTIQVFADVALDRWSADWIDQLWNDGYTAGCGADPLIYCPERKHDHAEATVFYLRMMYGVDYLPPDPAGIFVDVPLDYWAAGWIEAAYNAGLIPACETEPELKFCPDKELSRAMAAYMMVQAKDLPLP